MRFGHIEPGGYSTLAEWENPALSTVKQSSASAQGLVPVLYYLGANLGVWFTVMPEGMAILWPPNSVLLTVLLLFRGRGWLVFGLSAIAAEVAADVPTFTVVEALLFGLTNVAETTLVFALLRSVRFDPRFGALADLPKFVLSGPLLGALVAAGFGALRRSTRTGEMVARYGGEEFVFLIPETTLSGAVAMMERIRQALKSEEVETGKGPVRITASFGVALLEDADSDLDQTLRRADRALYEAKDGGRDRVVAAGRAVVQNRTE